MNSLRGQSDDAAEFLMVDDGSNDPVWTFLAGLPSEDARFRIFRRSDDVLPGAQSCRNIGLDAARGTYVMFLDSDDLLSRECVTRRAQTLDQAGDVDMLVGRQVMLDEQGAQRWVNVAKRHVSDLDRILAIGHPIDVPWVNGGVMFNADALRLNGVRWRSEFHWDDVAFHFECLVAGLRVMWMDETEPADSYYRIHSGERYGSVLSTEDGIRSAAAMIGWMRNTLAASELLNESRRATLARSLFRSCILPSIDLGLAVLGRTLISDAADSGVFSSAEASRVSRYARGRVVLRPSARATYYWNRFSDMTLVGEFFPSVESTYGTIDAQPDGQSA